LPSRTATQELVVPRSIPIVFPIKIPPFGGQLGFARVFVSLRSNDKNPDYRVKEKNIIFLK